MEDPDYRRTLSGDELARYQLTGFTSQGPSLGHGVVLLAVAVVPIFLFDPGALQTIAILNAVAHFVTGWAWLLPGGWPIEADEAGMWALVKRPALAVYFLTNWVAPILLVLSLLLLIF